MTLKIEYRIDTYFDSKIKAFQVTKKQCGTWPFRYWIIAHEELLYEGDDMALAKHAIEQQVMFEKANQIKTRFWFDDTGKAPPPEW